jgi:hypothetical protein
VTKNSQGDTGDVEPADDSPLRGRESLTVFRADRLGRVKEWIAARRLIDEDPRGKVFAERVAVVISRTYAELGDAATIADDVALMLIRDMLLDLDEEIIKRNRRKRRKKKPPAE